MGMNVLYLNDIDFSKVRKQFDKTVSFLENGDFRSAEVKKITNTGYYRAKLDYENRLLFKFARYKGESCILLMEVIHNHAYEKSRFLRGAKVDENKMKELPEQKQLPAEDAVEINYLNQNSATFHLLNKPLSFDQVQQNIFNLKPPVVIVGSAGSGKTVLTLEKIKRLKGDILYVTLSPFLADNSAKLYYSDNYEDDKQNVDFLSYYEFLETLKIISGKEVNFKTFNEWLQPRKHSFGIADVYKLFEEFRGVITGLDITQPFLSKANYLALGVKQSIFLNNDREKVYEIFNKYREFLTENNLYDLNIISFEWLQYIRPKYDFIVIDEVQDFTNIQLYIILKSLKTNGNFILCGDSNQIVHPNFFSWAHIKTMFYKHDISGSDIQVLRTNYRNSTDVTKIANKLLMIKNARFGSIDKESNFLVEPLAENKGQVNFFLDSPAIRKKLNESTRRSTKFAVLVMNQEEKTAAKKIFNTPLIFSIHEAKGLEYENIILLNFISDNSREFSEIAQNVSKKSIENNNITFSRGKDKADKSLDALKFYINSLYVGITRSVKNLYVIESSKKHEILSLLDLVESRNQIQLKTEVSSLEDWKEEARKLELQGKNEQADDIKKNILELKKPDWIPITHENIAQLKEKAFDPVNFNKKAKDLVFMYALLYNDHESIEKLASLNYKKAEHPEYERNSINRKYYSHYNTDNVKGVEQEIRKYGVNYRDHFNLTPLLAAAENGSVKITEFLLKQNADTGAEDNNGRNPLRLAINKLYFLPQTINKYEDLFPKLISDNIKVKVNDRLVKIPNRKMEFFLLNIFMTLQDAIIVDSRKIFEPEGIKATDLEKVLSQYPDSVLPDYRKKKSYISSMLAKNEIDSKNPYNNALFMRMERGFYCLNPGLSVLRGDTWVSVYEYAGLTEYERLPAVEREILNIEKLIKENERFSQAIPKDVGVNQIFLNMYQRKLEEKRRLEEEKARLREEKERLKKAADDAQYKIEF